MTTILLCCFSPITKTDISTSEYSSAYLYTNFKHFMLTLYYCLEEPVTAAPLFCDKLVITTVTHFTFVFARLHSPMKTYRFQFGKSIAKRGARWGAFIPWRRTRFVEMLKTIFYFRRAM